nr:hypothetical protein [Tanacetum cinerariifolium]
MPKVLLLVWDRVSEIKDAFENKQYKPEDVQELFRKLLDDLQNIHEELAKFINSPSWNRLFVYDDDDDDVNYTIAITPVLSTEEPDNSLSMGDEHLDTIPATESDEVIKSSVENLVPIPSEFKGIPDTMCDMHLVNNPTPLEAKDHFEIVINSNDDYSSSDDDSLYCIPDTMCDVHLVNNPTPLEAKDHFEIITNFNDDISSSDNDSLYNENIEYVEASPHDSEVVSLEVAEIVIPEEEEIEDDNLREKLLNVHLLIANIEALKDNPTPSSKFLTKSSSTSSKSLLEETNTFHNSLPEFENFCFDLEEISSGSTTTHSDKSLPDYEAFSFNNDHIKEISSGSTTTQSDISLSEYDSFIFHLCPPSDSSDFYEFTDKLAHIISPPEYDCFYFRDLPDPGELMSVLNSGIRENLSTTCVNLPIEDDHSPLLAYVLSSIPGNLKTLAKGYPPSLHFLSFNWESTVEEEQAAKAQNQKLPVCYDDDDDEEESNSLKDNIISELLPCFAVTPSEPIDSLSMGDEHVDTIPVTESNEFIKSCVENLVPNPSESEGKNGCDVPSCFTTFSNILFDADYDFESVDD